jgi:hypothetical protein
MVGVLLGTALGVILCSKVGLDVTNAGVLLVDVVEGALLGAEVGLGVIVEVLLDVVAGALLGAEVGRGIVLPGVILGTPGGIKRGVNTGPRMLEFS